MRSIWIITILLAIAQLSAKPGNWNQFRGPNGDGDAQDAEPPLTFGEKQNLKWKTPFSFFSQHIENYKNKATLRTLIYFIIYSSCQDLMTKNCDRIRLSVSSFSLSEYRKQS